MDRKGGVQAGRALLVWCQAPSAGNTPDYMPSDPQLVDVTPNLFSGQELPDMPDGSSTANPVPQAAIVRIGEGGCARAGRERA